MDGRTEDRRTPATAGFPESAEGAELVSVIIPAYNAFATIDETLDSVRAQTYLHLEIIVVDDGSTDATTTRVLAHCRLDPRVTLLTQKNGGVAAARNAGLAAAKGFYVAPLDADDVWRPEKIRLQVEAMRRAGDNAGLCCTGVCFIDGNGRIVGAHTPRPGNNAFRAMCRGNLVSNGSAALMPRVLVLEKGGFDEGLRSAGAQGCEDWKLYLSLVEENDLVVVPDMLTGYRQYPEQMSGNIEQMIRSAEIVLGDVVARRPDVAADVAVGLRNLRLHLAGRALTDYQYRTVLTLAANAGTTELVRYTVRCARRIVGRRLKPWLATKPLPGNDVPFLDEDECDRSLEAGLRPPGRS